MAERWRCCFPVDWPEPFGLVMIEALACGTPVIARPCGSVPEVIRDGVTGYIATSVEDLTDAVGKSMKSRVAPAVTSSRGGLQPK